MPPEGGARPGSAVPMTEADVRRHIEAGCALPSPVPTVGAEVEWLVIDPEDPQARPTVDALEDLLDPVELPGGSRITYEPGGQLELSGPPGRSPDEAVRPLAGDISLVREALSSRGWALSSCAHDRRRTPRRVNRRARYGAMESWFVDGGWGSAPEMMCNTAAVQVNVGCGPDPEVTWQRANRWAPVLAAAFATSPAGGWASGRLRAWAGLDPSRTDSALDSGHPVDDWTAYALRARAMLRSTPDGVSRVDGGLTLSDWLAGAPGAPPAPTQTDLELHLSTLFPPVRLKGWIEVRVIDMPPEEGWPVPVGVVSSLLCGPAWPEEQTILDPVARYSWRDAARLGRREPALAEAACALAAGAAARLTAEGSSLAPVVDAWAASLRAEPSASRMGALPAAGRA